jgi:6-phosphofructokinase 1
VSFVSLVAPTEEKYYETIEFYTHLGFQENYDFDRSRREKLPELDICVSSEKEKWLFSEGTSSDGAGSNITLKIRYVSDAVYWKDSRGDRRSSITMLHGQILEQGKDSAKQDWRGSQEATIFYTEKLNSIRSVLEARGIQLQFHPDNINPCEIYAFDPLGTLVGFTSKRNPFSKRVTQEQLPSAHITRDPSRVPTPQPGERRKKIAVLTSGGDAPGMNAAVRAVVRKSISSGCDAYIVREGYEGLVQGGNFIQEMGWEDVRGWLSEGGTLIGTARCMSFRERAGRLKAAKNLIARGIDALIVCGGDGSLTGADLFRSEWPSLLDELLKTGQISQVQRETYNTLNICGLVGSIDNDMSLTDATIGCYSSLARICQAVDYIDATASSHSRAFVIEVMGRHCGWLALMAGVATGADFILIPERPPLEGWEDEMSKVILKVSAIVIILPPILTSFRSTELMASVKLSSLLRKVPPISTRSTSLLIMSRIFSLRDWVLIPESQPWDICKEVARHAHTTVCWLLSKVMMLSKLSSKWTPRRHLL